MAADKNTEINELLTLFKEFNPTSEDDLVFFNLPDQLAKNPDFKDFFFEVDPKIHSVILHNTGYNACYYSDFEDLFKIVEDLTRRIRS